MNVEKRIDEIRAKLESDLPRKQRILWIFEIGRLAEELLRFAKQGEIGNRNWTENKEMIAFLDSWEHAEMQEMMAANEEN
jgi:hypothetical protein|tara:strand:- start:319 stop:558 length:240 start_codon:yes stop_codon:yes gene_type:complete